MAPALITEDAMVEGQTTRNYDGKIEDVVIAGAGPAGLMLASTLARYGIQPIVLDDRDDKTSTGRADGLQPKTLETFRQLRVADSLMQKGVRVYDICFWNSTTAETLRRTRRVDHFPESLDVLDPFILLVHQGMVEDIFLQDMSARGVNVQRSSPLLTFSKGTKAASPVEIECQDIGSGSSRTVKSRFLVGCDGAHSKVRRAIPDALMEGEPSRASWGVLDGVIETDFPDLWSKVVIHSETRGTILCVPREQNMTRLYIELKPSSNTKDTEEMKISQADVMQRAREIIHPYSLEWTFVEWFSNYKVGQRVASHFTDSAQSPSVFIAGDASHTHSPKAAQGMNTSMHDTFNLSWKLNLAIRGLAQPSLLQTYEQERRKIAVDLITFDFEHAAAFTDGDDEALAANFSKNVEFISGVGARYDSNTLNEPIVDDILQASRLRPGSLLPPGQATRYIDANPVQLTLDIPLLSQFRVYVMTSAVAPSLAFMTSFSQAMTRPQSLFGRLNTVAKKSYCSEKPVIRTQSDDFMQPQRYTCVSKLLTCAMITTAPKSSFEIVDLPTAFRESRWTVYLDDLRQEGQTEGVVSKWLGRDLGKDEVVVLNVRPDGYVGSLRSWSLDEGDKAVKWLESYYGGFLQA